MCGATPEWEALLCPILSDSSYCQLVFNLHENCFSISANQDIKLHCLALRDLSKLQRRTKLMSSPLALPGEVKLSNSARCWLNNLAFCWEQLAVGFVGGLALFWGHRVQVLVVLFQTEMWWSRGHSYLTSTTHLIALATFIGFVSHFWATQDFYYPFIFLGSLSWYLALPIQILKLSEWCLYVWFIFPLLSSPRGRVLRGM